MRDIILVTGSAGHLGEAVVRSLRAAARPVVGLDVKSSAFTDRVGSICDRRFVRRCLKTARVIIHAAALHKPHVATHSWREFLDTNVNGTLALLEAAVACDVEGFIYISTTSTFGSALTPVDSAPAVWVTEALTPKPKNIDGLTKLMAEGLCQLVHRQRQLPILLLRTSRFFPEADDDPLIRRHYDIANVQANELLYRRIDIEDVVSAIELAIEKVSQLHFGRYIISATTPFVASDLQLLRTDAPRVVRRLFPECEALYAARNWTLVPRIGRVYVNELARRDLGWTPKYDFGHMLECLRADRDFRSALAQAVGSKGYHDVTFGERPYPVD